MPLQAGPHYLCVFRAADDMTDDVMDIGQDPDFWPPVLIRADRGQVEAFRPAQVHDQAIAVISADFRTGGSGQRSGDFVADGASAPPGDGGGGGEVCFAEDG